jgi:hypothetical protein
MNPVPARMNAARPRIIVMVVTTCATAIVFGTVAGADELADALAPHVGQTLDVVELGTGRRLVRPLLEGVTERDGRTTSLRLKGEGEARTTSVPLAGIATIIAGRETIHQADSTGAGGRSKSRRIREARAQRLAESQARMQARGVEPWPELSAEEHTAHVAELEAFVERIKEAFPAVVMTQTHEFIVASDIPAAQLAPFTAKLDAMHDFLCDLYGIPRGEPVWKGKCLVVAFLREEDFAAFEARFMQVEARGAHGLCHQRSDGRVVMACHRGTESSAFAHMLVHETSHGFNHRWLSPRPLPNWLNEGIAEWVGTQVVPHCRQVPLKEARAAEFMKSGGTVGPGFFSDGPDHHIEAVQYGIASSLVRMLVARDRKKFGSFVQGIKEGLSVEDSLKASYGGTLAELLATYGRMVGVPGLKE